MHIGAAAVPFLSMQGLLVIFSPMAVFCHVFRWAASAESIFTRRPGRLTPATWEPAPASRLWWYPHVFQPCGKKK